MTLGQLFALVGSDPELGAPRAERGTASDLVMLAGMG